MDVLTAITQRQSVRAFLEKPVSQEIVRQILDTARYSPSGVNTQPWQVSVLGKKTIQVIGDAIIARREAGHEPNPDYAYYPSEWVEPYKGRRLLSGLAMYRAIGIGRDEPDKRKAAWYRNYHFFGAPVGLLFFIDARLNQGSWLDYGMFLQSVMLAATGLGLATCPQAAMAEYPDIVRETLALGNEHRLVCGMALGFADSEHPVNSYRTARESVENFTQWYD